MSQVLHWLPVGGSIRVSALHLASCVQLAAVLDQRGLRIKDLILYGEEWVVTAANNPFLEVGHQPSAAGGQCNKAYCSLHVVPLFLSAVLPVLCLELCSLRVAVVRCNQCFLPDAMDTVQLVCAVLMSIKRIFCSGCSWATR